MAMQFEKPLKVFMPVINDLIGDQRVHRMASALQEVGYKVTVIGRKLPDSPLLPKHAYTTFRMKLWFKKGKLFYLEYNLRLFAYFISHKVDIIHANDLDTLFASHLTAKIKRIPLVYDSHEYFTEVPELIDRPATRYLWLRLEKWLFPNVTQAFTVNNSIAEIYSKKYQIEVKAIRNVPLIRDPHSLQNPIADLSEKPYILLYQGALNIGRGIELMIETMQYLPECVLWIIGKGDIEEDLHKLARDQSHPERIVFQGFISPKYLFNYTVQATLGFSLEENRGDNYRLASPNKVYDYIQAHVPVVVSDLPEMRKTVESYRVGEILVKEKYNPAGLANQVENILSSPSRYSSYQSACSNAAQILNWDKEKVKLWEIYWELDVRTPSRSLA